MANETVTQQLKPTLSISSADVKELEGRTVGDKCELTIYGTIIEVRKPYEGEGSGKEKGVQFRLEIDKVESFSGKKTKRIY